MEWTEETIARLRALWDEGLSTAEIGRQLSITKNAVVGKAHRLGLPSRPSPIRRSSTKTVEKGVEKEKKEQLIEGKGEASPIQVKEELSHQASQPEKKQVPEPKPLDARKEELVMAEASVGLKEKPSKISDAVAVEEEKKPTRTSVEAKAEPKKSPPAPRQKKQKDDVINLTKRAATCCWPIGDPGTKGFRFCGKEALPGKPYCFEHAQIAYVKLRERSS
ncbi:GcrA family cell cycle regulator [Entomobacter blattae]|uniref:GcrA cell cycle regulator n=1 Tax=Entomobacter blattae TaxID=2762277 RepID=A0A7H1NPX8_9PROT|nr:GcrA family cell cycle regulator [Entomobacter blattae]QNT77838.1 GcrA cell cycle regulator [Entomobacter blattae]